MNAYSEDLRKKIVEVKERGMPTVEVARTFGVGLSSVKRYAKTGHAKGDRCIRSGAQADPLRPTSAQGGSWRRTSRNDRPTPSLRDANTCPV